jgi:pimeloyl-ACP methyl ester carboxylesterase
VIEETVSVNGVDLYLRRYGDPTLPPLVVVHGGPTWDHSYLLPQVAELSDVRHVVLPDLRGCGRSARTPPVGDTSPEALQPDLIAGDIAALAERYGGGRADVLGFSYGGRIALRVVEQRPATVDRLILASTTAYDDFDADLKASPDYLARIPLIVGVDFDDPRFTGPAAPDGALSRAMAYDSIAYDIWRLDRRDEWEEVLGRVTFSSDWNAPFASGKLRRGGPDDPVGALRAWGGPVLILHGNHEMSFPVSVARRLHDDVPGSTLVVVPDAAHMAHFDNPAAWVSAVRAFLS